MRIAAWFTREKRMLDVFRNGGDIHGETAERVLRDRQARQSAKPVNFGCLYGGGAERLRITARTEFGIEFAPEQAKQYHEGFFNAYPNLRRWHEAARNFSSELTYGATVFGRRRWVDPNDRADHWDWNRFQLATILKCRVPGLSKGWMRCHTSQATCSLTTSRWNYGSFQRSLIILGAGYVALKLGQMFHRFGTEVTLVQRSKQLLAHGMSSR
jgi:hypothetical protein